MANERTYPCLPCAEIDGSVAFYESLRFTRTYRQVRPNEYAVVAREEIQIHLFGIDGFKPEDSYGTVIVAVPDPDSLYRDFAAGLRKAHGKLPVAGKTVAAVLSGGNIDPSLFAEIIQDQRRAA